jgi:hypothetical protein
MQRLDLAPTVPGSVSDGLPQVVSSFADARAPRPRTATALSYRLKSMRPRMVMVVMVVMVVPMMRRIRQRDVCEKNQCDHEANNLTHDSIPNLYM